MPFGMIGGLVGLNGLHSDQLSSVFGRGEALVLGLALAVALLMPNTQQLIDEGAEGTVRENPAPDRRARPAPA